MDGNGNAYIAGRSSAARGCAPVSCTVRAFTAHALYEYTDAFVARLDTGGTLVWNTFLGSDYDDVGNSIAADALGQHLRSRREQQNLGQPGAALHRLR